MQPEVKEATPTARHKSQEDPLLLRTQPSDSKLSFSSTSYSSGNDGVTSYGCSASNVVISGVASCDIDSIASLDSGIPDSCDSHSMASYDTCSVVSCDSGYVHHYGDTLPTSSKYCDIAFKLFKAIPEPTYDKAKKLFEEGYRIGLIFAHNRSRWHRSLRRSLRSLFREYIYLIYISCTNESGKLWPI